MRQFLIQAGSLLIIGVGLPPFAARAQHVGPMPQSGGELEPILRLVREFPSQSFVEIGGAAIRVLGLLPLTEAKLKVRGGQAGAPPRPAAGPGPGS